jgi:fatty-acyl-CoA synthase
MAEKVYQPGESYQYPLILKKLLSTPLLNSPDREIVYREKSRYTYRTLNERINRLAGGLEKLKVGRGDTVAVFDYDSSRYLECFFAIPMMGAVMQTVNWRLSAEQILYTIRHSEAKAVIINADFLPILENLRDRIETIETIVLISEDEREPDTKWTLDAEYEELLLEASLTYDFPDLDENTKATTFYTTGTTGDPRLL